MTLAYYTFVVLWDKGRTFGRMTAIAVENLVKDYPTRTGRARALVGVSFHVEEGEIVGLLGPNGAGTVSYTHLTLPTNREV